MARLTFPPLNPVLPSSSCEDVPVVGGAEEEEVVTGSVTGANAFLNPPFRNPAPPAAAPELDDVEVLFAFELAFVPVPVVVVVVVEKLIGLILIPPPSPAVNFSSARRARAVAVGSRVRDLSSLRRCDEEIRD